MKKRKLRFSVAVFVTVFVASLFMSLPVRADDGKEYEQFLKQRGFYSTIIKYLRFEEKTDKTQVLSLNDSLIVFGVDFVFSLFCLWLTLLLLVGKKFASSVKNFGWFFFSFNLVWFVFLLFYKMSWSLLDFLVMRLRPDLAPPITDSYCFIIIVASVLLYIWVLARTFHLNFYGAFGTFAISNLAYLGVIFLVFSFINPGESRILNLIKDNLGVKPVIHSYLSDVKKITSDSGILSLVRIKPFHI